MKKLSEVLIIFFFSAFIFIIPLIMIYEKKEEKLMFENRNIEELLPFNEETFREGTYFESLERYMSDIFPARDKILALHTYLDGSILKKPVVNDVIYRGEGTPMLPVVPHRRVDAEKIKTDSEKMAENMKMLSDVCEEVGGSFYFMGIPEQYSYFRDKFPYYIYNNNEGLNLTEENLYGALDEKGVNYINMNSVYTELGRNDDFYSQVDHHFSFKGAYEAYKAFVTRLNADKNSNVPILSESDFDYKELQNPYLGSRNRKLMGVYNLPEKLVIADFKNRVPFLRIDNGSTMESVLYTYPMDTEEYIDYMVYMSGDIGETVFQTHREELPKLLIFGDSFTNPIETLIYSSFDETRCLDLRHYSEKTITEYVREYKPDVVLMVRDDTLYLDFSGNGDIK